MPTTGKGLLQMTVVGYEQSVALIESFGPIVVKVANDAAFEEATFELPLTKAIVPVATGNLRASGRVERGPAAPDQAAMAAIVYGGPAGSGPGQTEDVDYALIVHEDLTAHHPHGQAKYIEAVVDEEFNSGRALERMTMTFIERLAMLGIKVSEL